VLHEGLSVQLPVKIELVFQSQRSESIGVTIPPLQLARADEVTE
jgi:hypothetical protein